MAYNLPLKMLFVLPSILHLCYKYEHFPLKRRAFRNSIKTFILDTCRYSIFNFCIVLYCIDGVVIAVLMHCDLLEIYCAPPNLGITRT